MEIPEKSMEITLRRMEITLKRMEITHVCMEITLSRMEILDQFMEDFSPIVGIIRCLSAYMMKRRGNLGKGRLIKPNLVMG
jgi:hypothetical protein